MPREKIFKAIANLETVDYKLSELLDKKNNSKSFCHSTVKECKTVIGETIKYLESVDIRMEIDEFSEID